MAIVGTEALEALELEGCNEDIMGASAWSSARRRLVARVELSFSPKAVARIRIWCLNAFRRE